MIHHHQGNFLNPEWRKSHCYELNQSLQRQFVATKSVAVTNGNYFVRYDIVICKIYIIHLSLNSSGLKFHLTKLLRSAANLARTVKV